MDGSSYQDYIECMTEIQGKLILVRVSMGFELSRVDCIFLSPTHKKRFNLFYE